MVMVTEKALSALQSILDAKNVDDSTAIRLMTSPENKQSLAMVLDRQKETDLTVNNSEGSPLLLLEPSISQALAETIMDYRDSGENSGFTILPKSMPESGKN